MKRNFITFAVGTLLFTAGTFGAFAAQIGDAAAPLQIAEWIKGDAVNLNDVKGQKIVVVEFWATWCGPCKASIPHLSELAHKFADRGVVFVGVSDEDAAKVRPFVDNMGAKMDYTVAIDNNRQTSDGYMKAFGQNGIPCAFIVDREGRVAWVGHPMGDLEKQLEKLASAPVAESPADKKRREAQKQLREFTELAAQGGDNARLDALAAQLTALDKEIGGIEPGRKLDLADLRRTVRFQSLMNDYRRAVATGKPAAEIAKLEQEAAPLAPKDFKFEAYRGNVSLQRTWQEYYRAITGRDNAAQVAELTRRLEAIESSDVDMQTEIAWTLLTDEGIKARNPKLALKFAQAAFAASGGKNPDVLETYARALADNGNPAEAAKQIERALQLTTDDTKKSELKESLKRYQSAAAPK